VADRSRSSPSLPGRGASGRLLTAQDSRAGDLPLHLNWSNGARVSDLASRADRARVYEVVLQEGRPVDIWAYVDGVLLVDLWDELVPPRAVRSAWAAVVRVFLDPAA
jgi:hypothetical protein